MIYAVQINGVEAAVAECRKIFGAADLCFELSGGPCPRNIDAQRQRIDRDHATAFADNRRNIGRQHACTGADIEDAFSSLDLKQRDQLLAMIELQHAEAVVSRRKFGQIETVADVRRGSGRADAAEAESVVAATCGSNLQASPHYAQWWYNLNPKLLIVSI